MDTSTQRVRPYFYDICIRNTFNSQKLQKVSTASGVPMNIIEAMCNGSAVARSDAEKVLAAFSQFVHGKWTLNTVNVPLTNERVGHEAYTLFLEQ